MTTRRSRSVTQTTQTQKEAKKLLRLMELPAVYPIYEEAAEFSVNDVFWRSLLQFASRAKFPQGFFIRKIYLCYKTPKAQILKRPIGDTPREANTNFIDFVKDCTRMRSDVDILREKEESYLNPGEVKASKGVPEILLYNYFDLCRESWGVSDKAMKSYEKVVFLLVRIYGKKIVEYDEHSNIIEIKGIAFNEKQDEFVIDAVYWNRLKKMIHKPPEPLQQKTTNVIRQKVDKEDFEKTLIAIRSGRKNIRMEEIIR